MIAGVIGRTAQAVAEARLAAGLGYHAGLLSLAAWHGASEDELIAHCNAVAAEIPLIGFYLQPAVGGIVLSSAFWQRFAAIGNVAGIKIAPFNRYRTLDVIRGVVAAGAEERVTLYTGNDDHIVLDLVTPFAVKRGGENVLVRIRADCSATGACGRVRRCNSSSARTKRRRGPPSMRICWLSMRALPTATPRSSTSPTTFAGASRAAMKSCGGKGSSKEFGAWTLTKRSAPAKPN